MITLSYEQIKSLIDVASSKDIYDWAALLTPNIITIITVFASYYYFTKQTKQIVLERVIDKEVERLYEAADLFFTYSNAVSLYFSMTEKEFNKIIHNTKMEDSFNEKLKDASNSVYNSFASMHKAEFIMNSLDETVIAENLKNYREKTIEYRKLIFKTSELETDGNFNNKKINDFLSKYELMRDELEKEKLSLLKEIAGAKHRLKIMNI